MGETGRRGAPGREEEQTDSKGPGQEEQVQEEGGQGEQNGELDVPNSLQAEERE